MKQGVNIILHLHVQKNSTCGPMLKSYQQHPVCQLSLYLFTNNYLLGIEVPCYLCKILIMDQRAFQFATRELCIKGK